MLEPRQKQRVNYRRHRMCFIHGFRQLGALNLEAICILRLMRFLSLMPSSLWLHAANRSRMQSRHRDSREKLINEH